MPFRLLMVPRPDLLPSPTLVTDTVAPVEVPTRASNDEVDVTALTGATPVPVSVAVSDPEALVKPMPFENVATAEPVTTWPLVVMPVGVKVNV